ncbi:apoptosis-enhancing nuclease-like [Hyperolius riggenbachi]|uniref:apoptosis-enhancing nuclease-like n=1 Tax=Hyperolius riggenbachi TaxID=752182 RepID=UPI0035A28171
MDRAATSSLFYGFSGSSQYLNSSHKDMPADQLKVLHVRNHRKSRKHQRFMVRKAFLQKHGLLGTLQPNAIGPPGDDGSSVVIDEDSHCRLHMDEATSDCLTDQSAKLAELKSMLSSLPNMASESSACSTACDYDSGLSVSGSSHTTRTSSPVSWLKPGKCVAMDCEMVGTGPGARLSELARCSIVNYRGDVIYDKYIKPELRISDYRTRWSGITKSHMKNAVLFKTAQKEILNILKDKLVIGHALHNDFKALRYYHPPEQTRDTSKMPILKEMAQLPGNGSPSLKNLAWYLLHKAIQVGKKGHSSVEDAQTCMELYKLVEDHIEQDIHSRSQLSSLEEDSSPDNSHYMDDQYWPSDLDVDCK